MSESQSGPALDGRFIKLISGHRQGKIVSELSQAIRQVASAVHHTGKAGEVILRMKLKPASAGNRGTYVFEPKVKVSIPENLAAGSIFYADDDFNLVREDPQQTKLELRDVEQPNPATQEATHE